MRGTPNPRVGATIRALRIERGLKQSELADAVGIRQQTLYRAEAGLIFSPRPATLAAIARTLKVPIERLLGPAPKTPKKRKRGAA